MKNAPISGSSRGRLPPRADRVKRHLKSRKNASPPAAPDDRPFHKYARIFYFGSSPPGAEPLDLYDEVRAIKAELRGARHRCFEFGTCFGCTADDLTRDLRAASPVIVQIAGHSCKARAPRCSQGDVGRRDAAGVDLVADPACERGLVLHGRDGHVHVLAYELIRKIFKLAGSSVRVVVATACESESLARLLLPHVECAVGVAGPITDLTATQFSRGFYAAIGDGASVAQAHEAGCLAVECAGAPGADRIKLHVRNGVDAGKIVLTTPAEREVSGHEQPRRRPSHPGTFQAMRGELRRGSKRGTRVASSSVLRGKRNRGGARRR
jgi:hypothetical protein